MNTKVASRRRRLPGLARGRYRAGLSALEFIGCVMAVVGGVWLGAIYLGIDVRHVAHAALAETDMLDKVPAGWRPAPENQVTREQLVATLREELGGLRSEISALRAGQNELGGKDTTANTPSRQGAVGSARQSKERTLAYWDRLNEIAMGESALQVDAESAFNEEKAAQVFAIKARISRFTTKAVEAIPQDGVDRSVVQFGRQLGAWYDRAGDLYDKAVQIWESSSAGSQGRSQLNDEWRQAQLQHRNEARLLSEKASAVRSGVSRRFGHEFPEFVRPQSDSSTTSGANGKAG